MADNIPGTATTVQSDSHKQSTGYKHPLDPLTPDEIVAVSKTVQHYAADKLSVKALKFVVCNLVPPPKKTVLAYLGISTAPGQKPAPHPGLILRQAEVDFIDLVTGVAYNIILSFKDSKWIVESADKLPEGVQPQITVEELLECEVIIRNDPTIQKLAKEVGIEPEQIRADGWAIGYDERFPMSARVQQALVFARFSEHENLYAHPMDFVPVIDATSKKLLHIDFPSHYYSSEDADGTKHILSATTTAPPPLDDDAFVTANRERIPPPRQAFDFLPDLLAQNDKNYKLRDDLKPLHVIQPEGVSFKMNGHELEWQKWKMHIAFSHREGVALSTVTYNDDGEVRPVFYRLSLAEMVVPYAAPEHPHARKFAFDAGEYGMGTMANDLDLGCDCLGQIHYISGSFVGHNGNAVIIKNAICIHEEDAGLLWKHTDYRVGGRSLAVRARRLVVSMVCTLANYEYIWNYLFYQDGTIEVEVRLTGMLQTYVSKPDEPNPYGTTVAPQINAQYHQHIFNFRVDPMVDGLQNSVVETDVVPSPSPLGSDANFAGNAFVTQSQVLKVEGARDYHWAGDRRWTIINPGRKHYSSGQHVGYGVSVKGGLVPLLAQDESWISQRAKFATKSLWVVKEKEVEGKGTQRMWPAGKYVPQGRGEPSDSVGKWISEGGKVEAEDILLFISFGVTHIPRPEDFPVMPVERVTLSFKPQSFFKTNPSMDVPGAKDSKSKPAFENEACC